MMSYNVGDIIRYKKDWKENRQWYLLSLREDNLCDIVVIRNNSYTHMKNNEECLNANIVNLNINDIEKYE